MLFLNIFFKKIFFLELVESDEFQISNSISMELNGVMSTIHTVSNQCIFMPII